MNIYIENEYDREIDVDYMGEGTPKEYVMRYPFRSYTTYGDLKTDTSLKFYYLNRKFVGEGLELPNIYSELDLPFIRYADVLLNWAEALNELNEIGRAHV